MRPHGRARVDASNPQAFAACDRCGSWVNRVDLQAEQQWAGLSIVETGFLVCELCWDTPNEQLRSIILPPDPVPVRNPRIELAGTQTADYRITEASDRRITETDDDYRIIEDGLDNGPESTGADSTQLTADDTSYTADVT